MPENENPNPEPQGDPDQLGDAGKKALQEERKARAELEKQLKELQEQAKARDEAELSEVDRLKKSNEELAGKIGALESEKTTAALDLIRYQVATEKGLPPELVARLQGTDRESFEADADSLAPLITGKQNPYPKADPSQGPQGNTGARSNADAFADALGDF